MQNKRLIIPEDRHLWEDRLLEFQVFGDWVREGERVGKIDSSADLSTYRECEATHHCDFEFTGQTEN